MYENNSEGFGYARMDMVTGKLIGWLRMVKVS
jgi:hypothetical protein